MEQKHIKMIIGALFGLGLFAILMNWGAKIYIQYQADQLEKEDIARWKEQSLYAWERKVTDKLLIIERKLAEKGIDLSDTASLSNSSPVEEGTRHYFSNSNVENFPKVTKGMARNNVSQSSIIKCNFCPARAFKG